MKGQMIRSLLLVIVLCLVATRADAHSLKQKTSIIDKFKVA